MKREEAEKEGLNVDDVYNYQFDSSDAKPDVSDVLGDPISNLDLRP